MYFSGGEYARNLLYVSLFYPLLHFIRTIQERTVTTLVTGVEL